MPIRTLETPSGIGQLYCEEELIGEVKYRLIATQEIHVSHSFGHTEEHEGMSSISGTLKHGDMHRLGDFLGKKVRLHLQDGRKIDLILAGYDGRVLATGWYY